MCGIVGVVARPGAFKISDIERAVSLLAHRGPDARSVSKIHSDDNWEVWFGHARLSIVDLSPTGAQPMTRSVEGDRSATIVFNGEVYNHRELRAEYAESRSFLGTSDTEVLLYGFLQDGINVFRRANAMAALAIFENHSKTLTLMRDRLGKKPLYVYRRGDVLAFTSELKAFRGLGLILTQSPQGWAYYHWLRHIPAQHSIYQEVTKFPAASYASLSLGHARLPAVRSHLFWDALSGPATSFRGTYEDAKERFVHLLDDATKLRLDADVPVGVLLSAGVDSSLIAASIQRCRKGGAVAFVVRSEDPGFDESPIAIRTARKLGFEVVVIDLAGDDYERQVEKVVTAFDEPCAPLSQISMLAVAEAAAKRVKVVLTGDGGDELFLGYPWLFYPESLWRYRRFIDRVPGLALAAERTLLSPLGLGALSLIARALGRNPHTVEAKRFLALDLLRASGPLKLYEHFQQNCPLGGLGKIDRELLGPATLSERLKDWYPHYSWVMSQERSLAEQCAAQEMISAMRDEILVKVDRATMAHSLEARSPFLDYRMVEFALSLPRAFKATRGTFKRLLRDVCEDQLGAELARRPKTGFGTVAPRNLPPGPTVDIRWAREIENRWMLAYGGSVRGLGMES